MKIETNGNHACTTHAGADARAMTRNQITDYLAETGCKPRCVRCIYMSEPGEMACGRHSPGHGSDSWVVDRWAAITTAEASEFQHVVGRPPTCETCVAIARRATG